MKLETINKKNVPLQSIEVNGTLCDFFGKVDVRAIFQNNLNTVIETKYKFTLDTSSKICKFVVKIKDRTLVGAVRERGVAKYTYYEAVENKQTASLLQKDSLGNYSLMIGNIQPSDVVVVEYSYILRTLTENGKYKFVMPTNIGEKYIPNSTAINYNYNYTGHPDYLESFTQPPHTTDPVGYTFQFNLNWKSKAVINNVNVMNNIIAQIIKISDNEYNVLSTIAPSSGDFVIVTDCTLENNLYVAQSGDNIYSMLISQIPNEDEDITPKEFVFFIDKSGSMSGSKLESAKNALRLFLLSLNSDSKVNIVSFDNDFHAVFSKPEEYNDDNKAILLSFVDKLIANGGTEMMECITSCLNNKIPQRNVKYIAKSSSVLDHNNVVKVPAHIFGESDFCDERIYFLLTDGEVANSNQIINKVKCYADTTRIFTIGIGNDASRYLVEGIANATDGMYKMIIDETGVDEIVIDMLTNVYKTHYKNVNISFDGKIIQYGKKIYPGKYMTVFNKSTNHIDDHSNVTVSGVNCTTGELKTWQLIANKNESIPVDLAELLYVNNLVDNKDGKLTNSEIVDLCVKYNIMNDLASFIVVDDIINDQSDATITVNIPHSSVRCDECAPSESQNSCQSYVFGKTHSERVRRLSTMAIPNDTTFAPKSVKKYCTTPNTQNRSGLFFTNSLNSVGNLLDSFVNTASNTILNNDNSTVKLKSQYNNKEEEADEDDEDCGDSDDTNVPLHNTSTNFVKSNIVTGNHIWKYLKTDGHFEYSSESFSILQPKYDEKMFNNYCATHGIDKLLLFNILVVFYLKDLNENKYKMIVKNLKSWILKTGKITDTEFLTHSVQIKTMFSKSTETI